MTLQSDGVYVDINENNKSNHVKTNESDVFNTCKTTFKSRLTLIVPKVIYCF